MSLSQTSMIAPPAFDKQQIRTELKTWEHSFLSEHGRKPGKADIKANREMASKYKLYDKLTRGVPTSKAPLVQSSSSPSKKRKREDIAAPPTPPKPTLTSNGTVHPADIDPYDPPLNTFFSPLSQRSFVAPTPQKNGRVLGIFDLLSPESARKGTPSKVRITGTSDTPSRRSNVMDGTPSRNRTSGLGGLGDTPSRQRLSDILTPSRNRMNLATPSMQRVRKLDFDETPECLRRYPRKAPTPDAATGAARSVSFDDADGLMNIKWSPIATRQPRRRFGRSFSELAKDNRRREEKKLDDELDLLRDMEDEAGSENRAATEASGRDVVRMVELPGAGADLPLGPDGEREADRSEGEDERPEVQGGRKIWKRKGPKRQTKKFNLRPTHETKWKPEPKWEAGIDSESEADTGNANTQDGVDVVPETQAAGREDAKQLDDEGSEFDSADELQSDYDVPRSEKAKTATKPTKNVTAEQKAAKPKANTKPEKIKKPKKVSATAHANYRSLKIKNKNSKGKGGGRFGRRRGR